MELMIKKPVDLFRRWRFDDPGILDETTFDDTHVEESEKKNKAVQKNRHSIDYSVWEKWTPDDPASKEERRIIEKKKQDIEMKAFEENNAEFCDGYKADMESRRAEERRKISRINEMKKSSVKYIRIKQYNSALILLN